MYLYFLESEWWVVAWVGGWMEDRIERDKKEQR